MYGRLPEKLQLIELASYANQTKLFSMNCNNNIIITITNDFLAVGPALYILQLKVKGLCSQAFHHPGHSRRWMMTQSCGWNLQRLKHSRNNHLKGSKWPSVGVYRFAVIVATPFTSRRRWWCADAESVRRRHHGQLRLPDSRFVDPRTSPSRRVHSSLGRVRPGSHVREPQSIPLIFDIKSTISTIQYEMLF